LVFADGGLPGADALDRGSGSVESSSQLLLLPQLLLVLAFHRHAPAESFPAWLGPFVRYQPVSAGYRDIARRSPAVTSPLPVLSADGWRGASGCLALFGGLALRMQRRTQ